MMSRTLQRRSWRMVACAFLLTAVLPLCSNGQASTKSIDLARELRSRGYSADTPDQLKAAARSDNYFVRRISLQLLTERTKREAISSLREALNDTRMEVRSEAARLLGTLGDKSGLERMKKDLNEWAPNDGAPVAPDPNEKKLSEQETRKLNETRNLRLYYALSAASVLAEFGDQSGYNLAMRMALAGEWSAQRSEAVRILAKMARDNQGAESVLSVVAESESEGSVFSTLLSATEAMGGEPAIRILEKAMQSPRQSDFMRRVAKRACANVRATIGGEAKPVTE